MRNAVGKEMASAMHADTSLKRSTGAHPIYHPSGTSKTLHGPSRQPHAFDCHCSICGDFGLISSPNAVNQPCQPATELMQISDMSADTVHQFQTQGQGQEQVDPQYVELVAVERNMMDNWWDRSFNEFETDIFARLYGGYAWLDGRNSFPYQ